MMERPDADSVVFCAARLPTVCHRYFLMVIRMVLHIYRGPYGERRVYNR